MMLALAHAVQTVDEVELVLIEGRGTHGFCAGADIVEFLKGEDNLERQEQGLKALVEGFVASPQPIISAVHGRTMGAGVLIASLSDLVIAADNLAFGLPEIRFNMYPVIVQAALEEKVSEAVAFQLCATGRLLGANEARSLGLVSDVLSMDIFAEAVAERVEFYHERIDALQIGWRTKRGLSDVQKRVDRLAPLMHENFNRIGVRDTIARYLKMR
jgi:enoyl-CoA hydratase